MKIYLYIICAVYDDYYDGSSGKNGAITLSTEGI